MVTYLHTNMAEKKKTLSEIKRSAILEAARNAFKQFGVQSTSMDKLAKIAGVSKRTVYNHFASKETLVMYLVSDLWQKTVVDINVKYQSDKPLKGQLVDLLTTELEFIGSQEYLDLARVAFGHLFYNPIALKKELEKIAEQETAIHRWIKYALEDQRLINLDIEFANQQLHSLIKGSGFWPQLMGLKDVLSSEEIRHISEESAEIFLLRYKN